MAIWMMCGADEPGAVLNEHWSARVKANDPEAKGIYLVESHAGLVLETRESNGRDDSDFYAVVWNPEKGEPERVTYATTRGWTYPNHAAVDATDEVRDAYKAFQEARLTEDRARRQRNQDMTPTKGKRVRFERATTTKGVKIEAGTEATVFWYGEAREFGAMPRGGYKAHARDMRRLADTLAPDENGTRRGYRVGVSLPDGTKVFTAATNVVVIAAEAE